MRKYSEYVGQEWKGLTNTLGECEDNYSDYRVVEELIQELCGTTMDVEVKNFGWANRSGFAKGLTTKFALTEILPDTECTFSVKFNETHIVINNAHHDKPTGGEIYVITK